MNICPSCDEENAKKNSWCGKCGTRIREIPKGLERDILFVISGYTRRKRRQNIVVAGIAISIFGFFGYSWFQHTVATTVQAQVEALKPAIAKEANAKTEEMLNRELPKTLSIAMNAAAERFVDGAQKIGQQKYRQLESVYADAERDLKEKAQHLAAGYQTTMDGVTRTTAQNVALWTPTIGFYSDAIVLPTTPGVSGLVGLETNHLSMAASDNIINLTAQQDSFLSNITSTSVITQTTYSPACIGSVATLIVDATGLHSGKPEDCKNQQTLGGAASGTDFIFRPTKQ